MKGTSNYPRIAALGRAEISRLTEQSFLRTFATTQHHWNNLETLVAQPHNNYDVFKAYPQSQVPEAIRDLRRCLMQWGAYVACVVVARDSELNVHHYYGVVAGEDANVLEDKGIHYGDSWKKRGGVGAFMMLARKWDRVENIVLTEQAKAPGGRSIHDVLRDNPGGFRDDVDDLRRYLLLVEDEVITRYDLPDPLAAEPQPHGYVDQG